MKTITFDAGELMAKHFKIEVKVQGMQRYIWRMRVFAWAVNACAWVLGLKFNHIEVRH